MKQREFELWLEERFSYIDATLADIRKVLRDISDDARGGRLPGQRPRTFDDVSVPRQAEGR